eukprot:5021278-Amphidinium_carterae.1
MKHRRAKLMSPCSLLLPGAPVVLQVRIGSVLFQQIEAQAKASAPTVCPCLTYIDKCVSATVRGFLAAAKEEPVKSQPVASAPAVTKDRSGSQKSSLWTPAYLAGIGLPIHGTS